MDSFLKSAEENIGFYKGEDLFKWAWVGPKFSPSDPSYDSKMVELKRVFQGHNVLKELIDNWKDGLISEAFNWYLKDKNGKRVDASSAEIELQRWIDWVNQQGLNLDPAATNFGQSDPWQEFILSLGVCGEGNLRLWQPERFADDPDPIHRIHLHAPKVGSVEVKRGDDGFVDSIAYYYGHSQKEVQQFDEQGQLLVTVESNGGGSGEVEPIALDTGGRWLIQQARMPSLLTPSARQKQASICHSLTMKLRNQEVSGFRERTLINAEFPDERVERGPGIDTYLYGIPQGDPQNPSYATPQIHESEPIPVGSFVESIQLDRSLLYLEFCQGHLMSAGDGNLSGESRIQMRQGFELFLKRWKRPVESCIANTLNIVLRILGYQELETVVQLKLQTGKLSAEERQIIITEFQASLLSRSTAIAMLGSVDDSDAEIALLEEEMKRQSKTVVKDPMQG